MKKVCFLIIITFCILSCASNKHIKQDDTFNQINISARAQDTKNLGDGWIESTAQVEIVNITPEEAREQAIDKACEQALESYGVDVTGRKLYIVGEDAENVTRDDYLHLIDQTTQGVIVDKKIINEQIITINNSIFSQVTLHVKIEKQKGEKDPYFSIDASLNKEHFQENETLEISCVPSKDCYITILNICSNDTVYVLFPNRYSDDDFAKAGVEFEFPNKDDKNIGLSLPVELLPGKISDSEIIKIIATKESLNLVEFKADMSYGTCSATLTKLMQRLITIPRDQIVEYDLIYFVHK